MIIALVMRYLQQLIMRDDINQINDKIFYDYIYCGSTGETGPGTIGLPSW